MSDKRIRITYRPTGEKIADGPKGWGITPFEGSYYIRRKYLETSGFKPNFVPGFCPYKFLYVWLNFRARDDSITRFLGWFYWIPNPVLPFIAFRVAVPSDHSDLLVEEYSAEPDTTGR